MKKTEVQNMFAKNGLISNSMIMAERSTGKLNAAIDYYSKKITEKAEKDCISIRIVYSQTTKILEIYAIYDNVIFPFSIGINKLVYNMQQMNQFVDSSYEEIKESIIEYFEENENKQKEESEIDENWEFVDIGSI